MRFTVVTILPELIEPALAAGVVGRARAAGTIAVDTIDPRQFTHDRHRTVDDTPYGGGPGMVMKAEPLLAALDAAAPRGAAHRILLTPAGAPLTQARVRALAAHPHLVLACGRYEGVDERAIELGIDEQLSIGDYVLSGGELAALVVIDAVARLVPGVLGDADSAVDESHADGLLEYPHYTRPAELAGRGVPAVLSSGNHAAIAAWRRVEAMRRTATHRPDLWMRRRLGDGDRALLGKAGVTSLAARTHVALVHHPVVDRTGAVVTSALTNFDVHDLARSAMTYGLAGYHVVTPVTSQRDKAEHIARLWIEERSESEAAGGSRDQGGVDERSESGAAGGGAGRRARGGIVGGRAEALQLVRVAASIEDVIASLGDPVVVATSARADSFPHAARVSPEELVAAHAFDARNLLILFGTGWGLADALIPSVSRVLPPIDAGTSWNHLSVRSAAAVILDRLLGRVT